MIVEPQPTGSTPTPAAADRAVDAMLAEYQTLRQESLESMTNRMTIVGFTFAILGVLIAALLTREVSDLLAGLIAVLFVPQVAKASLLMWLGEYQRSRRAGSWLVGLEAKINEQVGTTAVDWESNLARQTGEDDETPAHMDYPYVAVVTLLLGAGYTAIAVGTYLVFAYIDGRWGTGDGALAACVVAAVAAAFEVWFFLYFRKKWAASRSRTAHDRA